MLDLKEVIENISKKIFLTIIIVQVIILIITIIVFSSNTIYVYRGMRISFENEVLKQSNIFKFYLTQKYRILLNDIGLITKYLQATRYETYTDTPSIFTIDSVVKNSSCSVFASDLQDIPANKDVLIIPRSYIGPKKSPPYDRLLFMRWAGRDFSTFEKLKYEDKIEIYNVCKIHDLINDIVGKHYYWSDIATMNIDNIHFSFGNGLYMKYPLEYSDTFNITKNNYIDGGRGDHVCQRQINDYDPRCRPFYRNSYSEKVPGINSVIISPYIFISGNVGSEICVKTNDNRPNTNSKMQDLLSCAIYNFRDLDLIVGLTSNLLFREKLFLTFYKPKLDINKISTIYHSGFPSENYTSFTTLLDIKSNVTGNYLTPDDLFENIYSDLFTKSYTKIKSLNDTVKMENFRNKVIEINNYYNEVIFSQIRNLSISLNETKYISDNDLIGIISNSSKGFFEFNETWVFDDDKNEIVRQKNTTYMYYIPIKINASLNDDYSLGSDQTADFYIMYFRSESVRVI